MRSYSTSNFKIFICYLFTVSFFIFFYKIYIFEYKVTANLTPSHTTKINNKIYFFKPINEIESLIDQVIKTNNLNCYSHPYSHINQTFFIACRGSNQDKNLKNIILIKEKIIDFESKNLNQFFFSKNYSYLSNTNFEDYYEYFNFKETEITNIQKYNRSLSTKKIIIILLLSTAVFILRIRR